MKRAQVHASMVYIDCPECGEGLTVPMGAGNEGSYSHTTDSPLWAPGAVIKCEACGERLRMPRQVSW